MRKRKRETERRREMRETERGSLIDCGDAEIGVTSAHWWKYKVPCGIEAVLRNAKEKTLL